MMKLVKMGVVVAVVIVLLYILVQSPIQLSDAVRSIGHFFAELWRWGRDFVNAHWR